MFEVSIKYNIKCLFCVCVVIPPYTRKLSYYSYFVTHLSTVQFKWNHISIGKSHYNNNDLRNHKTDSTLHVHLFFYVCNILSRLI